MIYPAARSSSPALIDALVTHSLINRGDATGARSGPPCRCAVGASLFGAVLQHTSCRRQKRKGKRKGKRKRDRKKAKRGKETKGREAKEKDQKRRGAKDKAKGEGQRRRGAKGRAKRGQNQGRRHDEERTTEGQKDGRVVKPGRGPDHDAEGGAARNAAAAGWPEPWKRAVAERQRGEWWSSRSCTMGWGGGAPACVRDGSRRGGNDTVSRGGMKLSVAPVHCRRP